MNGFASDVAFTPTVKLIQTLKGSRDAYAKMEAAGSWQTRITPDLAEFVAAQTSFFLATASAGGQPYIQHRGGPPGFLHVVDDRTLAFADFSGNRQYITLGNLAENAKAHLFLIDFVHRRRIKIWGEAKVVEDDPDLVRRLASDGYCPQHFPQRFEAAQVAAALAERDARIAELEAELAALRS